MEHNEYNHYLNESQTNSRNVNSITPTRIDIMQAMNYTAYIQDVNFFFQNSMSINMAVLALQILDYIMQRPKNQSMYPLPKNK